MANNLHFEYSLSVNEKQTQQNLATFIKKTFGTEKNAKLSVPIKLDITTNLTNVDLKSIQDQIDKQFKGKLTLNATVKVDASNVARQAQNELDRISKGLSLKVGLEVDPSAMKLMLGTVDVIKTLNKEVEKVKDNLKDLGKKIEININGAQVNQIYDGALKTAEKIQQVNEKTTEEINEQLKISKEKLAYQQKIADEKKKELEIEKDKQEVNKEIEKSNKKIREQQNQLNKEVKGIENQIKAEKEKAKQLDKQNKTLQNNAKIQADATEKMEKSTKKIAELEKQRANNQAFLNSKKEEEKALLMNIELGKQEVSLLKEKIREMEKLKNTVKTVKTVTTGGTTTSKTTTTNKNKPKTGNVVKVDNATNQAVQQAVQPIQAQAQAQQNLTNVVKQETAKREDSIQQEIKAQNQLAENTVNTAKKIDKALYRAEDSVRTLKKSDGRNKLYNNLVASDFASSLKGYRIHDVTTMEEQKEYQEVLTDVLVKSRGVIGSYTLDLKEGVALTKEEVDYHTNLLDILNKELAVALQIRGTKAESDGKFGKAYKAWLKDKNSDKLGSDLDFQAEKESKLGAVRTYVKMLEEDIKQIETALGTQVRYGTESQQQIMELKMAALEKDKQKKMNAARNQALKETKLYGDKKIDSVFKDLEGSDSEGYRYAYDKMVESIRDVGKQLGRVFIDAKFPDLQFENIDNYLKNMEAKIVGYKKLMTDDPEHTKDYERKVKSIGKNVEMVKALINSLQLLDVEYTTTREGELFDEEHLEQVQKEIKAINDGIEGNLADAKTVNDIKTKMETFKDFVKYTQAFRHHEHAIRGEVDLLLVSFERLKGATGATNEDWDKIAQGLNKMLGILGKTQEEVDKVTAAYREQDETARQLEDARKENIAQGKAQAKILNEQLNLIEKGSDLWNEAKDAITAFNNAVKNNVSDDELDDYILKLHELSDAVTSAGKDGGDFKESNTGVKVVQQQSKAVDDINVKYEKQAQALSKILDLQKKGEKVSLNIDKLIDSHGRGWKEVAQEQEKLYRKTNDNMLWFQVSHLDMNDTYFSGSDNLFEPAKYFDFSQKADDRESIIKFLSEYTAKMHILEELQEKMSNYVTMPNAREQDINITDAATKAKLEEADAYDAVLAKQKEAEKNDKIHAEWLRNKEIAIAKEPYLKASKELLSRMRNSAQYKNHKDDIKFMESFKNTQNYIDALKNGSFTLEQTVDAFKNLSVYAQDTFHMKPTTVEKIANKYLEAAQVAEVVTQETQEVVEKNEKVAETVNETANATKEKAQAEQNVTEELKQQASVAQDVKVETQNVAKETKNKLKAEQKISEELRKQVVLTDKLTPTQAEKAYEMIFEHLSKGGKLSTSFMNSLTNAMDEIKLTDYGSALGKRGALVNQGRKKKDGVFYNRTDEYKKLKEDADKVVSDAQKPLFDVYKMIAKNIKDAGKETEKSVKKAKADSSTAKAVNKTKKEQNQIVQEQAKAENKSLQRQGNLLQVAQDILQANKEGRQYTLDINNLLDDQGRTWQDIAKNSEKVYKNVKDANILYTSFENMDMNRAYGNDAQSNGIFTPSNYIDKDKYDKAKTDAERIALMSEYDGKFGILFSLEEAFKRLLEQENIQENIQEKVETSLYDQIQAIEKMTNAQQRFNAILELTGLNYDNILKNNVKFFKDSNEWQRDKNLQTLKMDKNYGLQIGDDKNPYSFLAYKSALPNDPNTVQGINAMGELYAIREVLTVFKEMSDKEKQKIGNEQKAVEIKKEENQVVQQVNQAKKEEVQIINQANEKTSQLKAELDSLEKRLSNLPQTMSMEQLNKRLKEIESDPEYSSIMKNIKNQAREEVKKSGRKVTDNSVFQHMFKLLDNLLMNVNYGGSSSQQILKQYGIKDLEKFKQMNSEHERLTGDKAYVEQVDNERKELEAKIKAKKEELGLSQQINEKEEQTTNTKQKQVTVQKQIVQTKQDEFKVSDTQAEVVKKETTLEEKKAKLQNMIRENKELMLQDNEVEGLKKEIALIDEKTKALKAQGETAKLYENLKMAGVKGKSADLMASNILVGELKGSDYGIEDIKKFKDEQVDINSLALDRADAQMRLDQNQELIEETIAYQRELDKLNGVVKENTKVQQENMVVLDQLNESTTKGLSDLKSKLETEKQITDTSAKTAQNMKKVAEYSDSRVESYNDSIQNYLNKAKKLKDSYIGDEELARMEEEKNLLKDKLVLLQKQGETCKMLINIAQRVEKGEGSFQELQSLAFVAPDQFGVENLEQFEKEQKEIHKLQKELGDLTYKIRDERDKPEDAQKYLEMASKEQKALREYIAEKTGANKADAVGLKQSKEQVEVIRELIVGLNDANRAIAGDGLSDLGLAKLETIMQLYQGTDGLSHASFGGLGGKYSSIIKDYDYDEEKILNRMATDLPWDLMKYHDLYPKLEKWYKELAELAKLGDSPEYQNLNKKVQSLQKTILGLIEDIIYNLVEQPIAKVDLWDSEMIHKSMYDYHKEYGLQEVDSSKEEGDAEATALEESVKSSMRAIEEAKQSWGAIKQEVQDVAVATQEVVQDTQEMATQTQQVEESMEDTVQATKEEAKVIKEPIEDFKTLEEYQHRYRKSPRGATEETFESEAHLTVNHPKFSNESIGHLEAMMEMFYTKDGGVMPSYKGMALPKEVIESLGVEKLNSLLAEYAIRFHKEFQKYVQDSYARMSYAKDLAEKGESIEDDHYFQKMTNAMEEFKAKLVNDAMKLIADISKSEDSVFYSNEKYDDLADYWLMENGKGHDVSMNDSDIWNNASSQIEYLTDQEKQLQDVIQSQLTTKKQIADTTKQEKQEVQDIVDTKQEEAQVVNEVKQEVQEVKQEVEEVNQEVETSGAKWKETYVHLSRVVEASDEFKKANLGAIEAWEEIKSNTESYELDEQWKDAVDAIKQYCEDLEIVLEDEEKLYEQRKQETASKTLANTAKGEKKQSTKQLSDETKALIDNKVAKDENSKASRENARAKKNETSVKQSDTKATQDNTNATNENTKAKQKKAKVVKDVTDKVEEMITVEKDATVGDYTRAVMDAIKKIGASKTYKNKAAKDPSLKAMFESLDKDAKTNRGGAAGLDFWQGMLMRVKEVSSKAGMKDETITNAIIPHIGGTIAKSKATKKVKELAGVSDTAAAKQVETATQETAKAADKLATATTTVKNDTKEIAQATNEVEQNVEGAVNNLGDLAGLKLTDLTNLGGTDAMLAMFNDMKQNPALFGTTAEELDKYIGLFSDPTVAKNFNAELDAMKEQETVVEGVVEQKKEEKEIAQEINQETKTTVQEEKEKVGTVQKTKEVQQQVVEQKKEEKEIVGDIVQEQKQVVVVSQQVQEINEEELQAMKDEVVARQKIGAEQNAKLKIVRQEIKEAKALDKSLEKSITQENKIVDAMKEKLATAQENERIAKQENEERLKQKAEMEAHIKLLEQQAEEKRQAIALLESEVQLTEDNTFQIKQLTKEYDKLQDEIKETQKDIDDLTDSYYEQAEQARKANNEASQKMIDSYMEQLEKQAEERRKEQAKYLPAISGEVGEYKGGGGSVPPSGGGNPPDPDGIDFNDRVKLRQRELMLQLQQIVHNKELNDEQKLGTQILAEQIVEIGQIATNMKELNWLTQNVRENMKEFKFSIKVDEDNRKELERVAQEERKALVDMYRGMFDQIDADEKLKAERQTLQEVIALYKEKTLAEIDAYGVKERGFVDTDRLADLRSMVTYMEQNIESANEYDSTVRKIGNAFREIKFDTNQTKQWNKMEQDAEKARQAQEKQAKAQAELTAKVEKHIQVKKEQAQLYAKEIMMSKAMRNATEEEREAMMALITQYEIKGNTIQEVNQCYAEMQRTAKNMRLDVMNRQLMEQETIFDKLKNGIKDYVRFSLDLDDVQGVMQNVTRLFSNSFEHIKVLDEAYTNVNQTMKISQAEFDGMAQTAYDVADASGVLGTEVLEMIKIYAGAGVTAEEVNSKLAGTVAFQNVSGLTGTDATNALQTILNQFQLTTVHGMEAGDAINYVGDALIGVAYSLSKDEGDAIQEIVSAVEDAGSVIAQSGGSLEWYAAVAGTLAEQMNATGSEVGGAMRMITARTLQQKDAFEELNDTGEETEVAMANAEKALDGLGISIRDSGGDLRSIEDILGEVAEKWKTMNESEQQFVAEKLAGTNRRTYFMGLMENYERVNELQIKAENSAGALMESSARKAESLEGKLNNLTNAQEKFYQTINNSGMMKSGVDSLTTLINKVTEFIKLMDGKWVAALTGATGALVAFKMVKDGLTFADLGKMLATTITKFLGLEAGAITLTGALTALKAALVALGVGAAIGVVVAGAVALVNSMKSAEEQIEDTKAALQNYKDVMAQVENDSASVKGLQMKIDKINDTNTSLDRQLQLTKEVNSELAQHGDSYESIEAILRNENLALQDRLDLLDREIEKRGEIARQAALDALNQRDMFGFGDDVYGNILDDLDGVMGEFISAQNGINTADWWVFSPSEEQINSYYEHWQDAENRLQELYDQGAQQYALAQEYFAQGIINEDDMMEQKEKYEQFVEDLLYQVQKVSGETGSSIALDIMDFGDPLAVGEDDNQSMEEQNAYIVEQINLLEELKSLYNSVDDGYEGVDMSKVFDSDVMKDFQGDITNSEDVLAHLGQKIAETENELEGLGATSSDVFNEQEKDVKALQEEYINACRAIEDIQGYIEQIGEEGGVSADMMSTLFDAGLLEGYTGALNDAGAIQEHLTSKIAESEAVARQAYLNMMKDDADFWAQKMANSEEWRDHENTVQQDIIGIMANSLGVQAADFSSFIDSKGGMRAVDYTNASTMAEAENTMQSSLATQVLGYASQLINSKAGYRQTDMSNVNEFLNSQGVAEAQTVQELATMWAEFYNAKVDAINNTMSEINSQIAAGWTDDQIAAMDGWFGDGSLRAKQTQLNKLQNEIKTLAATNLTMTNFFAGLDTYFNGVGGGVGQNTVGGGKIGGGGLGNGWKPTSTSGSGYKPSGGSGGSGGGSGSRPSGGSGSGGSGSGGKGGSGSGGSGSSEKEVEDMEAEIDRYYELNDAINDNEKAISQLQSKRDSITTKSSYKKSIEQEVALLNKQIQAYKNLQKEQEKERNEIKKTLSNNGFKFDKNGDISNYAKQVKKLQDQANKKTGTKKEQAIENVEYLIDLIERYDELHSEAIPETTIEILDLQSEIQELNKDLAENMKNIEKLGDRYFRVAQAMNDVTDALEMNQAKQEHADEKEKIKLMEQEIDLIRQQQKINKNNKKVAEEEAKELRKQLEESGVKFNGDGNISNYEVLIEKMEKDANRLVGQAQEDAVTEIEDLLELIEQYVTLTDDTIPELDQAWQDYANSIKDIEKELKEIYKEHQENAVQTQKDIASAYEHYLSKRYDKLKESLNKERDLYNDSYNAENFQRELDEQQRTLDEIAQQIAVYERDTSLAGQAKLAQLKEEYEAQRQAINDMVRENEHSKANEDFDKQEEALDNALAEALDPAKLVEVVNDAIGSGLITIGDQVMELDDLMTTWLDETGDGLYALGDVLKSELLDNLVNAHKILGDMNMFNTNGSVSFASSNALLARQNPSTVSSSSSNHTISFDAPLLYVSGNVDSSNIDELTSTLKDMEQRIYTTIANALK